MDEQFQFFKRTLFENIGTVTEDCLINKLRGEYQALCIVNTKKRAQNIYQELKEEGVYHLSTSMYPKHRKQVLDVYKRQALVHQILQQQQHPGQAMPLL